MIKITQKHINICRKIVRQSCYTYGVVDRDDLLSEAFTALVRSAKRFDKKRGLKFSTFFTPRVKGSIIDYIRTETKHRSKCKPTFISFDLLIELEENGIATSLPSSDGTLDKVIMKDLIEKLLNFIPTKREKIMFKKRFLEGLSLKEIGKIFGVVDTRISQILTKTTLELRERCIELY